jgi:hypothetical protein
VGGLIGIRFSGDVVNSFSTGDVSGEDEVGGLVGESGRSSERGIFRCFSTGDVIGVAAVGGLIGSNAGDLVHCFSAGLVVGGKRVGGLVGEDSARGMGRASVVNCFWDIETTGVGSSGGGTGLTTAQMQDPNTFLAADWDFIDEIDNGNREIWRMSADTGYPELRVFSDYEPMRSGGQGTLEDPYRIATAHELACIWFHPEAHYRLAADIDLDGATFSEAVIPRFGGSLDGRGHIIRNLHIIGADYPALFFGDQNLGLVGVLEEGASLFHLGVHDVNVLGCGECIGALAGFSAGSILGVNSTGTVEGRRAVGGLVGENETGTVAECWSSVTVTGDFMCGGLVGSHRAGSVDRSFSIGEVNGLSLPAGLIGHNRGSVTCCYSTAAVTGNSGGGGLIGYNEGGRVEHCYSAGRVSATKSSPGGLIDMFPSGYVKGSFWDTESSGQSVSAVGVGLSTEWMKQADTFLRAGWDFEETWWICEGKTYPRFQWEKLLCH